MGGALLWNQSNGAGYTSGFGVGDSQRRPYLLTAGHCGEPGHQFADGTGKYIGNRSAKNADQDIALIPTDDVESSIYVGGDGSNGEGVAYWGNVYIGQ